MIVSTFVSRPWIPFYNCGGLKDGWQTDESTGQCLWDGLWHRWLGHEDAWMCAPLVALHTTPLDLFGITLVYIGLWQACLFFFKDTNIIREMKTSSLHILFVLAITSSLPVLSHVVFNLRSVLALLLPFSSNFPENKKAKMQMFQISQLCLKKT